MLVLPRTALADRILRWPSGYKAAFSLSTDDGLYATVASRHAHYYEDLSALPNAGDPNTWGKALVDLRLSDTLVEMGERHHVLMTHYIDTRQLDEPPDHIPSNPSPQSPAPNPPWEHDYGYATFEAGHGPGNSGSWEDWAYVASLGHEIASHSVHHLGGGELSPDAPRWNGSAYLPPRHSWLPAEPSWWREYLAAHEGGKPRSFVAPRDEFMVSKWRIERELRARATCYPELANYTVYGFSYPFGEPFGLGEVGNTYVSARVVGDGPVDGDEGADDWEKMPCVTTSGEPEKNAADIERAIAKGVWLHKYMHGLGKIFCCARPEKVIDEMIAFAAARRDEGLLWISTVGNVSRYVRERLDAELAVDRSCIGEGTIVVTLLLKRLLSSPLAASYNYPLTVEIDVPADWHVVTVPQGSRSTLITPVKGKLRFDVVPEGGPVTVQAVSFNPESPQPDGSRSDGGIEMGCALAKRPSRAAPAEVVLAFVLIVIVRRRRRRGG